MTSGFNTALLKSPKLFVQRISIGQHRADHKPSTDTLTVDDNKTKVSFSEVLMRSLTKDSVATSTPLLFDRETPQAIPVSPVTQMRSLRKIPVSKNDRLARS
jgi:hypothetical protein